MAQEEVFDGFVQQDPSFDPLLFLDLIMEV